MTQVSPNAIRFYDYEPEPTDMYAEVVQGLNESPRTIAPKFFYDHEGSRLFDAICGVQEYYPTRTESAIIRNNIHHIAQLIGSGCLLVEPGSGNSQKVRELLDAIQPHAYLPMDISGAYLRKAAQKLALEFPWLEVHAVCADFTESIKLPYRPEAPHRVAFFPGSSIGNFDPQDAVEFLSNISKALRSGGGLLIGVDLKKDEALLNAAYNDNEGMTAAFNLNLLTRINSELDADFDIDKFRHHAFYNKARSRVEMHLISNEAQNVNIGDEQFQFAKEETIHTENSYKYSVDEFQALAKSAGFTPVHVWLDENELFSVHYFEAV